MRSTFASLTCGLALVASLEGAAEAGNILVFGDHAARADAQARLVEAGHDVVVSGALPADLTGYDVLWHVGAATVFDDGTRNRMGEFMKTGGGVFLTGEWACCETMNASIQQVVNRFVRDAASAPSSIAIGGQGTGAPGSQWFNPGARGGVATAPHELAEWRPGTTGKISGVGGWNVLVVDDNDHPTGAIWAGNELVTGGQLIVLMDSDWYTRAGAGEIAANLAQFLIDGARDPLPEDPRDWQKPTVDTRAGAAAARGAAAIGRELGEGDDDELGDDDLAVGCAAGGGAGGGFGLLALLGAVALVNRKRRGPRG